MRKQFINRCTKNLRSTCIHTIYERTHARTYACPAAARLSKEVWFDRRDLVSTNNARPLFRVGSPGQPSPLTDTYLPITRPTYTNTHEYTHIQLQQYTTAKIRKALTSFCISLELLRGANAFFFLANAAAAAAGSVETPRFFGLMSIFKGAFSEPCIHSSAVCDACPEKQGGNRSSWNASD